MSKNRTLYGAFVGFILSFPIIGILYLSSQAFGAPFAPFAAFEWITRTLPGPLVTGGIDLLNGALFYLGISGVSAAKSSERLLALGLFSLIGAIEGTVSVLLLGSPKLKFPLYSAMLAALAVGIPFIYGSVVVGESSLSAAGQALWLAAIFLLWGAALHGVYRQIFPFTEKPESGSGSEDRVEVNIISRRQFLIYLGGTSVAITLVGAGLGRFLETGQDGELKSISEQAVGERSAAMLPNADAPVLPVPGTRPEITPIYDHYRVFIGLNPPEIDTGSWRLPITGLVDHPIELTLDDLREKYPARNQYVTLRCISGRVGTNLIGTTLWTGASLREILADTGVKADGRYLILTSADGFYETINLDLVKEDPRIMLAYAWNGAPLPVEHGYPLRVWIPDVYGMKQPKWITGIEVAPHFKDGYWVERGWDIFARVNTTSVIDTVAVRSVIERDGQKLIPIGGIAYSGARGISKVEVQVDDGEWEQTQLRAPLSETTWVIWRFEWPYQEGNHQFSVRCYEADGTPQIAEKSRLRPRGATGIHTIEEDI